MPAVAMEKEPHARLLHALAQAKSKSAHKKAIRESTPAAGKKVIQLLQTAQEEHGMAPESDLARAQLRLLMHPDSTHDDFKKATEDQHGEGLGAFLGGLAKGLFAPVAAIGKAIFHSPHARKAAGAVAKAGIDAATQALVNKAKAKAAAKKE